MDINQEKDNEFDKALRPLHFTDFIGQLSIINNLKIFVEASNQRNDALDHTLFHGPPGLGKTTLAHILANELKVGLKVTSGPVIDKPGDLAGLLTSLEEWMDNISPIKCTASSSTWFCGWNDSMVSVNGIFHCILTFSSIKLYRYSS